MPKLKLQSTQKMHDCDHKGMRTQSIELKSVNMMYVFYSQLQAVIRLMFVLFLFLILTF